MRYIKNCDGEHCEECVDCTNLINSKSYTWQINNGKIFMDMVKEFVQGNTASVLDITGDTFKELKTEVMQ